MTDEVLRCGKSVELLKAFGGQVQARCPEHGIVEIEVSV